MTFPILGGNGAVAGYSIDNSLRFNDNDNTKLERTFSAGDQTDWTFSAWVKRGNLGSSQIIFGRQNVADGANIGKIQFESDDTIKINNKVGASTGFEAKTNALFRDVSAWYHIFISFDGNQSTHNDRAELYVNGVQQSWSGSGSLSAGNGHINLGLPHAVGYRAGDGGQYFDGYIAEMYFIDGNSSLSHTDFGEFDSNSGIWKPIEYTGSFSGTNTFYLDFENSGSLGADQSGNGNNFTPTNLASTDQTTDTPTNNFATLNAVTPVVTHTLSEANLKSTNSSGTHGGATATINYPTSGKWYHEVRINAEDSSKGQGVAIGNQIYRDVTEWGNYRNLIGYFSDGSKQTDGGYSSYGVVHNAGDIIGVAYNADDQELTFYHDNSSQGTITTSEMDGTIDFNNLCPIVFGRNMGQTFNFGQDSSFAGAETRQNNSDGNGFGDFYYAPPSGYLSLCTKNLATALSPTIDDGSEYFQTALWSGTGGALTVTNDGNSDLKPDFLWVKNRNNAGGHRLHDSNRPLDNTLKSHTTDAEGTETGLNMTFETDGFSLNKNAGDWNFSGRTYVGWQWKANGGTTSSNTDGSITSTVQANTTAGFSIITYTGSGVNGATVGHGLGKVPDIVLTKNRSHASYHWLMYHSANTSAPETDTLFLNLTNATSDSEFWWNDTAPTSSVFSLSLNGGNNDNGNTYVAYCFNNVEGYSKFGSYTGNGSSDGTFVYTGFRPAWILFKKSSDTGRWLIYDTKRDTYNYVHHRLVAEASDSENTGSGDDIDIYSNGWKLRNPYSQTNASGAKFIYLAFAENPFVTSGAVPVTAR